MPKALDYFDYKIITDLKQPVFQDEYFKRRNCGLLLLSPENTCKIFDEANIKFKTEVNFKKAFLEKPAHLNSLVEFTSPEIIKLTLQQRRLQCKQLVKQISAVKNLWALRVRELAQNYLMTSKKNVSESYDSKFSLYEIILAGAREIYKQLK